jgi:hypothetical protein
MVILSALHGRLLITAMGIDAMLFVEPFGQVYPIGKASQGLYAVTASFAAKFGRVLTNDEAAPISRFNRISKFSECAFVHFLSLLVVSVFIPRSGLRVSA